MFKRGDLVTHRSTNEVLLVVAVKEEIKDFRTGETLTPYMVRTPGYNNVEVMDFEIVEYTPAK